MAQFYYDHFNCYGHLCAVPTEAKDRATGLVSADGARQTSRSSAPHAPPSDPPARARPAQATKLAEEQLARFRDQKEPRGQVRLGGGGSQAARQPGSQAARKPCT